ncbi:MAG TPA: PD-(D/E)XK nuclease family protein, partial [Acidimicrobiia bacterium]
DLVAVAHRRPRDRWRRIRFLLEHARAWDAAGDGATLRGFVEWARRQADENASAIEMPAPERDDDAVRILTMHGAKGLEFPIVILGGLAASPITMPAEVLFDESGPLLRAGRQHMELASAGYAEQRELEKAHVAAERARLLYVAATRARDHLLVSQHYNAQRQTLSFAAMLAAHLDRHPVPGLTDTRESESGGEPTLGIEWSGHRESDADITYDALVAADAARLGVIGVAAAPRVVAATRIRTALAADAGVAANDEIDDEIDDEVALGAGTSTAEAAWPRGRAGTAIGRAVHAVMQHADLHDASTIPPLAHAQAQAEQIPEHEGEVAALAARMHAADVVREAATRRHWREVPVAAQIEGMLVEGYIDLLYENADGALVVVDYKTDRIDHERDLATLASGYAPQAAAYALALERALGRTVASAVLLFVTPAGAVEREVVDLPEAVDAVRNYCRRAGG